MEPTLAEIARTLLRGRLPGVLRIGGQRDGFDAVHATDHAGSPLLLILDGSPVAAALAGGTAAALAVDDVPPLANAPCLGHATVAGPLRRLDAGAAREAVLAFADANPVADLFDVGDSAAIYRLDVERARLDLSGARHEIDPDAYRAAAPDPLHVEEKDLLLDLANHHAAQIGGFLARSLRAAGIEVVGLPLPVRLDRYGFVVAIDPAASAPRWLRLDFPMAMGGRLQLAHFLHPVLFHDCAENT